MSLIYGCPPKVIWLRMGNITTDGIIKVLILNANVIKDFILNVENADKACLEID